MRESTRKRKKKGKSDKYEKRERGEERGSVSLEAGYGVFFRSVEKFLEKLQQSRSDS